jgi:hypothetical protein
MPKQFFFYRISCLKSRRSREVICIQHYETTDIFIGAFFLSKGGILNGIRIKDPARGIAAFEISGEGLDQLDREYRTGAALVNPVHLRDSLNLLRDMLFDLRTERRRSHERKRTSQPGQSRR